MEQPPPLTPQEMSEHSGQEYSELGQPQPVKIFGITHLVLGAYGVLAGIMGLVVFFIGNPFLKMMAKTPEMQAQMKAQAALQE